MQAPARRQFLHAGAGLVLADELLGLLGGRSALRLALPIALTLPVLGRGRHERRLRGG